MRIKLFSFILLVSSAGLFADRVEDSYIDSLLGLKDRSSVLFNSFSSVTSYSEKYSGINIIDPNVSVYLNTAYASSMNDGALWQGNGISYEIKFGVEYLQPMFEIRFYPIIWGSQNSDFDIIPTNQSDGYGHYWGSLDNLQRYGSEPFYKFNLGQTDVRFVYKNYFTFGLSNENITLGSSKINPLLLSHNASGFLHIDYGTNGIVDTPIGGIEARIVNGMLQESDYFDENENNNEGFLNLMTIGYSPKFLRGFSIGLNLLYVKPFNNLELDDFGSLFVLAKQIFSGGRGSGLDPGSDDRDTMVSLNCDWSIPELGLNIYGEWGRTDFGLSFRDLIRAPEHTQAFTIGFNKILNRKKTGYFILGGELTTIGQSKNYLYTPGGSWYRHGWIGWTQGYTNRGQNLGASIGPGSNSQYIGLDYIFDNLRLGGFLQRITYDNDYFYNVYLPENGIKNNGSGDENANWNNFDIYDANRTEISFGINTQLTYNFIEYQLGVMYSYYMNRDYIPKNDVDNFNISFSVKYEL